MNTDPGDLHSTFTVIVCPATGSNDFIIPSDSPEFYGDLVYRIRKIVGKSNFSQH